MKYSRKGQRWTVEEDEKLAQHIKNGSTIIEMCASHLRPKNAILSRIKLNNLTIENIEVEEEYSIKKEDEYICVIDTETTGKNVPFAHVSDSTKWESVRMVQFAYELYTKEGELVEKNCVIICPQHYTIPIDSISIHGITNEIAVRDGIKIYDWFLMLSTFLSRVSNIVAHNIEYDSNVILSELYRYKQFDLIQQWNKKEKECTMMMGKRYLGKWVKLAELATHCDILVPSGLHQADVDTNLCALIYFYLYKKHMSNRIHVFPISMDDKNIFKLLGGRWNSGQKVWYMDEAEPYFNYAVKWFM